MALSTLTTPGVYVQEISTLPPSIAPLSTAVPAFIGYTEKGPKNSPVRITSLLEYEATFGGAFSELYQATITDSGSTVVPISLTGPNRESPYELYYHMQMYFSNGGGPCHIISVNKYNMVTPAIVAADFYVAGNTSVGVGVAEEVDEVTLLVAPEVTRLSSASQIQSIYDAMLAQCDKLKDRFAIFDVQDTGAPNADSIVFRNTEIGANFLKYGAAYYPRLNTTLGRKFSADNVTIVDTRNTVVYNTQPNNRLATIGQGKGTYSVVTVANPGSMTAASFTIIVGSTQATFTVGTDFPSTATIAEVVAVVNANSLISPLVRAQVSTVSGDFIVVLRRGTTDTTTSALNITNTGSEFTAGANQAGANNSVDTALYNSINDLITARVLVLGPSGTMAGIYASVDSSRGVWKAPANVGISNISGPSFQITEAQQGGLNVDATSGKSINAIRTFVGRGTLVWGSRTLDGNSNEWRYIPVRRLFTFVEESCKKSTEFVVFEPNDKSTWLRVQGTISNFLTDLWKQGALAGDKPEQAFFVRVGLGETMTAQDILEGKMIVSIGMAAVRPAEFIVLQFMHKLQEA
jgi:phage tail sheath protein FI